MTQHPILLNDSDSLITENAHMVFNSISPFSTNVPLLYPLKTPENRRFSVFREYRGGILVEHGLRVI